MTLIRRTNPLGELISLRQAMDRLFEDSYGQPSLGGGGDVHPLALDLYMTTDSLVVEAALPGVKPEDVDVSVTGDTLTISGATHQEQAGEDNGYSYREIRRGSFSRTVSLPTGLKSDAATATFENGLLRLSFPKADEAKPRQIQIKQTSEGQSSMPSAGQHGNAWLSSNPVESGDSAPNGAPWQSDGHGQSKERPRVGQSS